MLTDRPSLTPRLIAIRQAVARGDYSCLGAGGEALVFAYAKRCGIGAAELLHEWADAPSELPARAAQSQQKAAAARPGKTFSHRDQKSDPRAELHDLDYWASDYIEPPTDDDDDAPLCPVCDGRGKDAAGNQCEACGGSGRVSPDEDRDDEDNDDEFKDD